MNKIKKILAPTDLSDLSRTGVRHALETAHSLGAEVIVYYVITYEEVNLPHIGFYTEALTKWLPQERKKLLSEFLRDNFADMISKVEIKQEVEVGVPYQRIVEKAVKEGVEMIVMSTHGRTGLLHMLLGSVTEKVVRHAPCPVLSIRPAQEPKLSQAIAV